MPMLVSETIEGLEDLTEFLGDVQRRFSKELTSDLPSVNRLVQHINHYRGKMLRPLLVLLSAKAAEPNSTAIDESLRVVATVVEMVHMATLVHDDVLDEAETRRKTETLNHLSGNETAVMLGDYLISHSYHLCTSLNSPWISRAIARTTNTVCEGEVLQLSHRGRLDMSSSVYFDIIRRKTASLCGVCCELGAKLQNVDESVVQHLTRFGEQLGMAFQIVDDLLDLTGHEASVGKTLGTDLTKGKLTLPLIRLLEQATPQDQAEIRDLLLALSGPSTNGHRPALTQSLMTMMSKYRVLEGARQEAEQLIKQAKACLTEVCDDSPARRVMLDLSDRVLDRSS